jgi:hypothetical protein
LNDDEKENEYSNKELDLETLKHFIENHHHKYMTAHSKVCFAIIARIYRRVRMGYVFGAIKVSEDAMVVDGNHRYIAYRLANIEFEVIEATRSQCDELKEFRVIEIDIEQDWDLNNPMNKRYCNDDFLK